MNQKAAALSPCLYCQTLTSHHDQFCCSGCRYLHQQVPPASFAPTPYESEVVRRLYDLSSPGKNPRYRFSVKGLQCSSCVHVLEDLPQKIPGLISARVQFAHSELYIETEPGHPLGALIQLLEEMGYPAEPLRLNDSGLEQQKLEDRQLLKQIAVAGACAGNIMLFAVAIYGGLKGPWAHVFHGLSFLLFLPIVFYSANSIYRNVWSSLRLGYITADLPLVIALWLGFVASTLNWLRGSGSIYFDSTAGFFFLILVARWFLKTCQRRWTGNLFSLQEWNHGFFKVVRDQKKSTWPATELLKNDEIILNQQQLVPVDGTLLSSSAVFDTSWMTGESVPRTLQKDMKVCAGYRLLSDSGHLKADGSAHDSELARSLQQIQSDALAHSERLGKFDRAAQILLISVFGLGLLMLLAGPYLGLNFEDSFERALALFIVACPCALAFGGPLAYGMALKKAAQAGVWIKSADVIDRVNECQQLIFDKTGTLTQGALKFRQQTPADIPDWMKDLILALEKDSQHPVAYAFREIWAQRQTNDVILQDVTEILGQKIFGVYQGRVYSLQSDHQQSEGVRIALLQDGEKLASFEFSDELRKETPGILKKLSQKFQLSILSGDRQDRVDHIAQQLQVPFVLQKGNCSPLEKAQWVQKHPRSLMIGDGVNDVAALSVAHVGAVIQGPLLQGLRVGSVYFHQPGLRPLLTLLECAHKAKILVQRNLLFTLAYNIIAGTAALCGLVNPLVAAVLMPISSVILLISTWEASR